MVHLMLLPYAALAETGPEDAEQFASFLDAAGSINCVNQDLKNPDGSPGGKVRDYAERYVWEVIRRAKQRRLPLEQEWLEIQRMAVLKHDTNQAYVGRSNAYMPVYRRNRKTIVSNLSKGLFPSDDYMDVADMEQGDTEQAKAVKLTVEYELDHSGLRQTVKNFLGQFVDFGISCYKVWYRKEPIVKGKAGTLMDPMGMNVDMDEGVTCSARSMFNVVVYPEWAESKRELQLEAERLEVPISYVNFMHQTKKWENVEDALTASKGFTDEWDWVNMATMADVASIPNTFELRSRENSPVEAVIIVEAWCKMRLPNSQYAPNERPGTPLPVRVVFVNGVCVLVRRNPFYHQQSPFVYARDNQVTGSFYSDGAGRSTKDLQYLANDFTNQINDCGIYTFNPMAAVNTNYFSGNVGSYRPGHVFKTRDVEKAIKFFMPPVEIMQYGAPVVDRIIAQAQQGAGAAPILQGKTGDTATSDQIAQHNSLGPLQDTVEDIESDVMVPIMKMAWELSRQYRSEAFTRLLADGSLVQFLPSKIQGNFSFRFLSSSQSVNRQQRQQGLMMFADLAGKMGEALMSQGMMLNPIPILQRVWSDALGFRGFDRLIVPMPMQPGMPGMGPPGMPPGAPPPGAMQQPGAMRPPSAVGQGNVPGAAQNEPVPGEGNHMANVRDQVEAVTGPMGGGLTNMH